MGKQACRWRSVRSDEYARPRGPGGKEFADVAEERDTDQMKTPDQTDRIAPRPGDWDFPTSDEQAELETEIGTHPETDPDDRACWTCGGDGFAECDENDCFHAIAHLVTCPNCRGSGDAKDVWYW